VLPQANAYAMIRRRAGAAGIETKLGNHSFRVKRRRQPQGLPPPAIGPKFP